jgi:uncharacterized protein YcfJ
MKTRSSIVSHAVLLALGATFASSAAFASPPSWSKAHGHRDARDVYARVVDVDPIVRRVRVSSPQRECWNEERPVSSGPSRTEVRSTLVGGLIGAAAGYHISERTHLHDPIAVVGGSLIGAAIGNSIGVQKAERRGEYRTVGYETVQRCQVSHREQWAEEIDGYRVTYVYRGREYVTQMPYDPGQRIRVNVDVRPEFERRY